MTTYSFQIFISIASFLCLLCPQTRSLRILQIAPGFSSSHILFNFRIARTLTDHGHNVTILAHMMNHGVPTAGSPPGIELIRFEPNLSEELKSRSTTVFQEMAFEKANASMFFQVGKVFREITFATCEQFAYDHKLIDYLKGKNFDVVLSHFFIQCPLGWSQRIGVEKFIYVAPGAFIFDHISWSMALPQVPSYSPGHMASSTDRMTFMDRVTNVLWSVTSIIYLLFEATVLSSEDDIHRRPPYLDEPSLATLGSRVKTILVNGEQFLDYPLPMLPGMLHMGDLERKKIKELPMEWKMLADGSDAGVVLCSFGTVANTSSMPLKLKEALLHAFSKFPNYTIIWRVEGRLPDGLTQQKHIRIVKWMPQRDLLHHPKMKLFITHGGYNSILESAQAGVPMIVIPLFADQFANAQRAKRHGLGVVLDKMNHDGVVIEDALRTVLTDNRFHKNALRLASVLSDHIIPNDAATVRQIERVVRASDRLWPSMSAARRLNWMQYFCLDILACFTVFAMILLYATMKFLQKFKRCFSPSR